MTEFGYILIIVFEVMFGIFALMGLIYLEKRVKNRLEIINTKAEDLLNKVKNLRISVQKINNGIKTVKKLHLKEVKEVVLIILDTINFILLVKSMKFKRGKGLSLKDVKKLIPFGLIKKALNTIKSFA